jgi:O-antigen/teichoic acid export membrane protein
MELLYVTVIGAGIGFIVRYTMRGREHHGALVLPAIAGATTAAVWALLVWLGLTFDGGWIWVISLLAALAVSVGLAILLPRKRVEHDRLMLDRLLSA